MCWVLSLQLILKKCPQKGSDKKLKAMEIRIQKKSCCCNNASYYKLLSKWAICFLNPGSTTVTVFQSSTISTEKYPWIRRVRILTGLCHSTSICSFKNEAGNCPQASPITSIFLSTASTTKSESEKSCKDNPAVYFYILAIASKTSSSNIFTGLSGSSNASL